MAYQHGGHKSLSLYWSVCIDPRRGLHAAVWQPSWWCISAPYPSRVPDTLSRRDSVGERRTPRRWAHLCFFFLCTRSIASSTYTYGCQIIQRETTAIYRTTAGECTRRLRRRTPPDRGVRRGRGRGRGHAFIIHLARLYVSYKSEWPAGKRA